MGIEPGSYQQYLSLHEPKTPRFPQYTTQHGNALGAEARKIGKENAMAIVERTSRLAALASFLMLVVLATCVPAGADFVRDKTTNLMGYDNVGQLTVYSLVTKDAGVYTYSYSVTYDVGTADVHIFGLENPNDAAYSDAANSMTFDNPIYSAGYYANIEWAGDAMRVLSVGQTAQFSYKSLYAPQDIDVYCYAIDGGAAADGGAIGMGDVIPEPASMLVLIAGVAGMLPKVIRRGK
jgi:hypothetical protein